MPLDAEEAGAVPAGRDRCSGMAARARLRVERLPVEARRSLRRCWRTAVALPRPVEFLARMATATEQADTLADDDITVRVMRGRCTASRAHARAVVGSTPKPSPTRRAGAAWPSARRAIPRSGPRGSGPATPPPPTGARPVRSRHHVGCRVGLVPRVRAQLDNAPARSRVGAAGKVPRLRSTSVTTSATPCSRRSWRSATASTVCGVMGRYVIVGLFRADRQDGWAYVRGMLRAAQRQEGLRQAILEAADEAHRPRSTLCSVLCSMKTSCDSPRR